MKLRAAGKRAHARALVVVGEHAADTMAEPIERYARACDLADHLTAEWIKAGRPTTASGGATGGATVPHPLVAMIRDAEKDAAKFWSELTPKRTTAGRPVGSASAPDRKDSVPPKLRMVKSS